MISIIVPVYKVEPYLEKCVKSILKQTYKDFEVLLVDDGSPDHCGEMCEKYAEKDNRIRVFHTDHKGLSFARNYGLREACGDYIGFVDSDDWIEPDMYEVLLDQLVKTDADICICGFWLEYESSSNDVLFQDSLINRKEALKSLIKGEIGSYAWNKLFRKEIVEEVSFPEEKFYEDILSMCIIFDRSDTISVIASPKYHYRQRENSISKSIIPQALIDYSEASVLRFYFFLNNEHDIYEECQETIELSVVRAASHLWRWWYVVSKDDKAKYKDKIRELKAFTRENIPLFGYPSWPLYLRISTIFMRSDSWFSFAVIYGMNQLYRKLRPKTV